MSKTRIINGLVTQLLGYREDGNVVDIHLIVLYVVEYFNRGSYGGLDLHVTCYISDALT